MRTVLGCSPEQMYQNKGYKLVPSSLEVSIDPVSKPNLDVINTNIVSNFYEVQVQKFFVFLFFF